MSKWRSMKTAPKDGTIVWVYEENFPKVIFKAKMGMHGLFVWDWMPANDPFVVAVPAAWKPIKEKTKK